MKSIKINIINGIDLTYSIKESLINSTLVYESNPQNDEKVNKSLDLLEANESISQFTTNEFTITVDEEQANHLLNQSDLSINMLESWAKSL